MGTTSIVNKLPFDTNVGGLKAIYWIDKEFLQRIAGTDPVKLEIAVEAYVDLVSGEFWRTVDFIKETAQFIEEPASGANGPYVKIKISFQEAMHKDGRVSQFALMREREFFVCAVDNNDNCRFVGEINLRGEKKGMTFFEQSTSGSKYKDRNEYSCYFYCECANKARVAELRIETGGPGGG